MMLMELLPLIGGGIFGAVVKLFAMSMQNRADNSKQMIDALKAQAGVIQQVNEVASKNSGFAFTRRVIALALTAIIVVIALFPMIQPINVMTEVTTGGEYLFGLIDTRETKEVWNQLQGSVILPVIVPSFQAIIGTYFGASIASTR